MIIMWHAYHPFFRQSQLELCVVTLDLSWAWDNRDFHGFGRYPHIANKTSFSIELLNCLSVFHVPSCCASANLVLHISDCNFLQVSICHEETFTNSKSSKSSLNNTIVACQTFHVLGVHKSLEGSLKHFKPYVLQSCTQLNLGSALQIWKTSDKMAR